MSPKKTKKTPQLKEKLDAWLDESVNQPLAKKGFESLGAGLSAAASTVGSLFDSEDNVMAMTVPGSGQVGKKAAELTKRQYLRRLDKEIKAAEDAAKQAKAKDINYKSLQQPRDTSKDTAYS